MRSAAVLASASESKPDPAEGGLWLTEPEHGLPQSAVLEWLVESLYGFLESIIGPHDASAGTLRPGWLVFYDWDSTGQPQHVGIIDDAKSDYLHTVEYNTTFDDARSDGKAGHIVQKIREYNLVLGYVALY